MYNKNNSTWVTFNSSTYIKCTFSSWVTFNFLFLDCTEHFESLFNMIWSYTILQKPVSMNQFMTEKKWDELPFRNFLCFQCLTCCLWKLGHVRRRILQMTPDITLGGGFFLLWFQVSPCFSNDNFNLSYDYPNGSRLH